MTNREKIIEEMTRLIALKEMAETRADFKKRLEQSSDMVIEHLVLLLLNPNSENCNHWKSEIYGQFKSFKKLKYSNKYPTIKDFMDGYMETCFECIEDQMEMYIKEAFTKENNDIRIFDLEDVKCELPINIPKLQNCIKNYFVWLIHNVDSKTGLVSDKDAYNKMDELIKAYNE